jgi:flagellar basal body P-ring formation protein FlgA
MTRFFVPLFAVLLAVLPSSVRAEIVFQPTVTVTGNVIHLGDLFTGAGAGANDPVAPAPALGTRVTYSAAWLGAIARDHHLDWQPSSDFNQTTVERVSRTIGTDVITRHLLDAMGQAPENADAVIRFDNSSLHFLVPGDASDDMAVDGLNLDPHNGRFSAFITAPPSGADAQRQRVTGTLIVEVEVPVPARAIPIGEIISGNDIELIKLPRGRFATDTITNASELIGKSARHVLRAEQPLRAGDVEDPLVVHKGDLVTVELRTPTMVLSAQGKALEDGAMGVAIRVTNTQSNRTIDAVVIGANQVRAGATATSATN